MTALTFESIGNSPRRAAARRSVRTVHSVAPVEPQALALSRTKDESIRLRNKRGLIALIGLTVVLHGAIYTAANRPMVSAPLPPAPQAIVIDMAPPPPPPPVVPPKPIPQVIKPVLAPVKAAPPPPLPVAAADTTEATADTVQVAKTAAPPAPPAPVVEEKVTEPRGFAGYLNNPAPNYPPEAQRRKLQGRVLLNVHVLANGKPDDVQIFQTSGSGVLDESARKTVTSWSFEPAKRGTKAVDAWVKVPINFKLS